MRLEVKKIGNSLGVILTKTLATKLHANQHDYLYAVSNPDGVTLTPYEPHSEKTTKAYEKVARRYRKALKTLAKK